MLYMGVKHTMQLLLLSSGLLINPLCSLYMSRNTEESNKYLLYCLPFFPLFSLPLPCLPCPIEQNELNDMETWKKMKLLLSQTTVYYQYLNFQAFLPSCFCIFMLFLFVFQCVIFPLRYQMSNNAKQKTGKCFSF